MSTIGDRATLPWEHAASDLRTRENIVPRPASLLLILALVLTSAARCLTQSTGSDMQNAPPDGKRDEIDILLTPRKQPVVASAPIPSVPDVKISNYTLCSLDELRHGVPDLSHLKAIPDQSPLASILVKVGERVAEIARKTPNLISHESVLFDNNGLKSHQDFSFLILQHQRPSIGTVLEEFRVDLATGEKFEMENLDDTPSSASSDSLELPSVGKSVVPTQSGPMSQGSVSDWLHFYPSNRRESEFRYLGEQKLNRRRALVIAFAEKPGWVLLPFKLALEDRTVAIFKQGIAWIDPSDFKILRLRADLLSPVPGVPVSQLTSDIHFSEVHVSGLDSQLWLPTAVSVTILANGDTERESHVYSNHRLFRAHSKMLLNP